MGICAAFDLLLNLLHQASQTQVVRGAVTTVVELRKPWAQISASAPNLL